MEWDYLKKILTTITIITIVYFIIVYIIQGYLFEYSREPEITAEMIARHIVNDLTHKLIMKGAEHYKIDTTSGLTPDELAMAMRDVGNRCNGMANVLTARAGRFMQKKRI